MCDYSLSGESRIGKENDQLVAVRSNFGSIGFTQTQELPKLPNERA